MIRAMRWIGLTGGIACGKSTVSHSLRRRGYSVIDADLLAREVVRAGTEAHRQIAKAFGADSIGADGELNRAKIGSVVFSDRAKLQELEQIIHPKVRARTAELRRDLEARGVVAAFYDVPLLFERDMQKMFDQIVVVTCSPEIQFARLMARSQMDEIDARRRVAAQWPLARKEAEGHHVIQNNGDLARLEVEIERVLTELGLPDQS